MCRVQYCQPCLVYSGSGVGGGGKDDVTSAVLHCWLARLPCGIVKPVLLVNSTQR
jgi:hypothetical protein